MQSAYALPAELTIYTVAELHPQWLAWMDADTDGDRNADAGAGSDAGADALADSLHVDAQAVVEVDAAGVQLLLSLSNALARDERRLHLSMPSAPLVAACRTLGAGRLLTDASVTGELL